MGTADFDEYVVDAGWGHTYSDWIESRDDAIASASPAVGELLRELYGDSPGREFITGWPCATL